MPTCTSCGTSVGTTVNFCPKCGTKIQSAPRTQQPSHRKAGSEPDPSGWYNNSFLLWGALILFFPLGLYGVVKNKTWSVKMRFFVFTGVSGIALIWMIGVAANDPDDNSLTANEPQLSAAEQARRDSIARVEAAARSRKDSIEARERKIESQFSPWDGAHRTVENAIEQRLKDPDSYEHIETRYRDDGNTLFVVTRYRAKNSFGGYVVNRATATVDLEGSVLELDLGE